MTTAEITSLLQFTNGNVKQVSEMLKGLDIKEPLAGAPPLKRRRTKEGSVGEKTKEPTPDHDKKGSSAAENTPPPDDKRDLEIFFKEYPNYESVLEVRLSRHTLPPEFPSQIKYFVNLRKLYIDDAGLTSLPREIGELGQLQVLDCAWNQLTSLPREIGQMRQLQELYCDNNRLTSLPAEIGNLGQLQVLDCAWNQLTSLPDQIWLLSKLQELYCDNNQLTSLPVQIRQLSPLLKLACYSNQLTSLPDQIGRLSQLQELVCYGNRLTSLPDQIGRLSQLQKLGCGGNQLTSLPGQIVRLRQLKVLNCAYNQLTSLPDQIGQMSKLQELYCAWNQLTSLPADIGRLSLLKVLNCRDNHLTSLPVEIGQLSKLKMLVSASNPFYRLPLSLGAIIPPYVAPPTDQQNEGARTDWTQRNISLYAQEFFINSEEDMIKSRDEFLQKWGHRNGLSDFLEYLTVATVNDRLRSIYLTERKKLESQIAVLILHMEPANTATAFTARQPLIHIYEDLQDDFNNKYVVLESFWKVGKTLSKMARTMTNNDGFLWRDVHPQPKFWQVVVETERTPDDDLSEGESQEY